MITGRCPDEEKDTEQCPICGEKFHVALGPTCSHSDEEWRRLNRVVPGWIRLPSGECINLDHVRSISRRWADGEMAIIYGRGDAHYVSGDDADWLEEFLKRRIPFIPQ